MKYRKVHLQLLLLKNDDLDYHNTFSILFKPYKDKNTTKPLAICNGVLCLTTVVESSHDIILWNPTIKKMLTLPKPIFPPSYNSGYACFLLGFAFNSLSNDYKVLKVLSFLDDTKPPQVEIFSLNKNSWKGISEIACGYQWLQAHFFSFFYEAIHCIYSLVYDDTSKSCLILGFDVNAEAFQKSKLSQLFDERDILESNIYQESNIGICCSFVRHKGRFLEVWVMKDCNNMESWEIVCRYDTASECMIRYFVWDFETTGKHGVQQRRRIGYSPLVLVMMKWNLILIFRTMIMFWLK
ncbi:F-box protein CPR1-like [Rutidosis leptorrhynchoides]|uniref:F-box protein CPR1-like n=1 Tax=Rutidosis leptorrhynchoides TaxID=125765 RepID=UPI003A9948DF